MERAIIHFWTIPPHSTPLQSTPFLGCTVRSGRAQPFYSLVGFFYATFSKNQNQTRVPWAEVTTEDKKTH